jgi:hypothetical protein
MSRAGFGRRGVHPVPQRRSPEEREGDAGRSGPSKEPTFGHERFEKRIEDALVKMANGCERRRQDPGAVERRVGKLLGRNTRVAGMFDVKVTGTRKTGARVTWTKKPEWREWARLSEGCYLLRSNVTDWEPDDLWRAYIQLAEVENAFRIHKTELRVRPIWHQRKDRVQAHILFSFLAYAMPGALAPDVGPAPCAGWKTLQTWMERAGLGRGARTVVDELAQIRAVDVVLKTSNGRHVRLACVTRPTQAQQTLLDHLGIQLPERLGRPRWIPASTELNAKCSTDFGVQTAQIAKQRPSSL